MPQINEEKKPLQEQVSNAVDSLSLSSSMFDDFSALFGSIREQSEKHTLAYKLAGIGMYLADDYSNVLDCAKGDLEHSRDVERR